MDILQKKETIALEGDINFTRVLRIRKMGEQKILQHHKIQFDFSKVLQCDSSALALLLAWKRFAKLNNVELEFFNVPASLLSLATVCNVKPMITDHIIGSL